MPRGGRREGAGRPNGSRSKYRPVTVEMPKQGTVSLLLAAAGKEPLRAEDAVGLLRAAYMNEALPENMRLAAAIAAAPYEKPRLNAVDARVLLEQSGASEREAESYRVKLLAEIERLQDCTPPDERVRAALTDAFASENGDVDDDAQRLIDEVAAAVAAKRATEAHITEVTPPQVPVVVRRVQPGPVIEHEDGAKYGVSADCAVKAAETADVGRPGPPDEENRSHGTTDFPGAEKKPEPEQATLFNDPSLLAEPLELEVLVPTRAVGGGIRWVRRP